MGAEINMAILDILKKFKLPQFGDDFIQDDVEQAMEEAPLSSLRKAVYTPRQHPEIEEEVDTLGEWMRQNNTPGDAQYIPLISDEDGW
jgi:hypothetical protein